MQNFSEDGKQKNSVQTRLAAFGFGGDYNPAQWTQRFGYEERQVWLEDMRLMRLAQVNIATVGVFDWSALQPAEDTFTFQWLDQVMDLLAENGISACLATATAAIPAWLAAKYPDVLPVDAQGIRRGFGERQNYCPTSPDFRRLAKRLAKRLAQRYGQHPALLLWHVSNEYYGGATDRSYPCHCTRCAECFRTWLQARYGTLEEVNRLWMTAFWSHIYTDWSQIEIPGPNTERGVQGQMLDFKRFISDMYLECYLEEAQVLREVTPDVPITTNFLGAFKALDASRWGPHLDIVSWDSYPARSAHPAVTAFQHDLMRGLNGGKPFILMEQTPSQVQWMPQNPLKRPGVMRLLSYQAVAHGADSIQYFQWRQSRGSAEMFHGAVVSHAGHENTRVFADVATLGEELHALSALPGDELLGARFPARVALLFSWPNWWNVEFTPGPSNEIRYLEEVLRYYRSLWQHHIAVDVIAPDDDFSGYDLVVAPLLNMVSESQGQAIEDYVKQGGTFLTTYFSGVVDEHALAWLGGYPGPLRKTLGIWVEEFDPLEPTMTNTVVVPQGSELTPGSYRCQGWCDLLHLEGAQVLATFGEDFYAGRPALTEHQFGAGRAFYVATQPEQSLVETVIELVLERSHLADPLPTSKSVEITYREGATGSYMFVLNHGTKSEKISLPTPMYDILKNVTYGDSLELPATGVVILRPVSQGL